MRKSLSLILVVFLSLSFLATTGFSYTDCGKNCCCSSNMNAMHRTAKHPAQIKGNCCPDVNALPCGLKKEQDFELPVCAISTARAETNSAAGTVAYLKVALYGNSGFKHKRVWFSASTFVQSSPTYLQHLSLLI
jgi:hypothetical protein